MDGVLLTQLVLTSNQTLLVADETYSDDIEHLIRKAIDYYDYPMEIVDDPRSIIKHFINHDDCIIFLLYSKDQRPIGILIGQLVKFPLYKKPYGTELLWWVDPDERTGKNPFKMLEAYEYWCRLKGCDLIKLGMNNKHLSRKQQKRLHNYYRSLGYDLYETSYHKELRLWELK